MKKRYAAIAAITLGLFQGVSTIGAVPASGLTVEGDDCYIVNSTLFAFGSSTDGMSEPGNVTLQVDEEGDELYCILDTTAYHFGLDEFDEVIVAAEGTLEFDLEGYVATDRIADFPDVAYSVAAPTIRFDGSGVTEDRDETSITVSDEEFDLDGVGGDIDYVKHFEFEGTAGDDEFDASDATVDVLADGNGGADVINGGEDDDDLTGGYGNDKLFGNDGDDDLNCREYWFFDVHGGSDADETPGSKNEADQCWGGDGDDDIQANAPTSAKVVDDPDAAPNDKDYYFFEGNDIVAPGDGDDDIDEAAVLYYGDSSESVEVSVTDGEVTSDAGDDVFDLVASYVGSSHDDTFYGSPDPDSFTGGGGDDSLYGFGGDDTLNGGGGNDTIIGDGGADTIKGNGGDDLIKAGAKADSVNGGAGDDVLYGARGDDTLLGKAGSDEAWGGTGKDLCIAEVKDSCEYSQI